jgi:hypothetical protein
MYSEFRHQEISLQAINEVIDNSSILDEIEWGKIIENISRRPNKHISVHELVVELLYI